MGSFEKMNIEKRRPWLAIGFGCCTVGGDDEGKAAKLADTPIPRICYEEPRSVPQPRAEPATTRPSTSHSIKQQVSQWVLESRDTLTRPRRSHSTTQPTISQPTNFQHFDGLNTMQSVIDGASAPTRRRGSYRPLELSIYFPDGRLSPLPNFCGPECWDAETAELEVPVQALVRARDSRTNSLSSNPSTSSYLIQRKPVGSGSRRSSMQSQTSFLTLESRFSETTMTTTANSALAFPEQEPKTSVDTLVDGKSPLQRSKTSGTLSPPRAHSRMSSPCRGRSNTAPTRPGSLRRTKTDVDEAIRELNTIVEERRASAYHAHTNFPALINRPPPSPSHHVPFIAPTMRMQVRSETLSDIGSAFSTPLANKPLPTPPKSTPWKSSGLKLYPPSRFLPGSQTSSPISPSDSATPTTPKTTISRLGAWLRRSVPNTPAPSAPVSRSGTVKLTSTSFYQCSPPTPHASRPSTAGSRTLYHDRQNSSESDSTATVTLFSSSSRASTFHSTTTMVSDSEPVPARAEVLKGLGKQRRVPAPLVLVKDKEIAVEAALASARSVRSERSMKPPASPHYGLLRGMELKGMDVGVRRSGAHMPSPGAVGVAF